MYTCGHGKPIDEFCKYCEEMGEQVLEFRETIKKLEDENIHLKKIIVSLKNKLDSTQKRLNRTIEDSYNNVILDRDE